jgi:hypothetical protein
MIMIAEPAKGFMIPPEHAGQASIAELEGINRFFGMKLDISRGNRGELIISTDSDILAERLFRVLGDTFGAAGFQPHRINPQYH